LIGDLIISSDCVAGALLAHHEWSGRSNQPGAPYVHGLGFHDDPSWSFLKLEVVMKASLK
jgi:hypothetical protein